MKSEIKNKIKRYFLVRNQRKLLADELQRNLVRIQKEKKELENKLTKYQSSYFKSIEKTNHYRNISSLDMQYLWDKKASHAKNEWLQTYEAIKEITQTETIAANQANEGKKSLKSIELLIEKQNEILRKEVLKEDQLLNDEFSHQKKHRYKYEP